jgi:MoaA/NifB/PqqE/SkfB family radical SAM enzyme
MKLSGLHFLLTYQCTFECDHCFVWGSPWQSGVMSLADIRFFLEQARQLGTIDSIYFEGGEPFLYYATLLQGVRMAAQMGFQVGVVSNAYWATSQEDALETLKPFTGLLADLSVSSDLFHYDEKLSQQVQNATAAADQLGIPLGVICIASPEEGQAMASSGQLPTGESGVMYRGRAAEKLVQNAALQPWHTFNTCPHEDLREPGRMHLDPLGNLHICQGISLGNLHEQSLTEICAQYDPELHPICGTLLEGGPAALVRKYGLGHQEGYADACHLCYSARLVLHSRFPQVLTPEQMYGVNHP